MASKNMINELHRIKLDLFKSQDLENGQFDVIFEVEGKRLYAHKPMLNLVSTTFATMFSDQWMKNKDQPIIIEAYSYDDFHQLLTFLYSGECQLTETNISSMIDIAEFYAVDLFKTYCDEYLAATKITTENIFQLMDIVDKYSMAQLKTSAHRFITKNLQSFAECDGFLNLDKSVVEELVISVKDEVKPEELFQGIYNWTENRGIDKQAADPNINLQDAIKNEITDFLPHINFCQMELHFLNDFVVSRGFIFSSYKELSKILCEREEANSGKIVKITNENGQTLHGNLIPDKTVIENIKSLESPICSICDGHYCYWDKTFNRPSTPSPLMKKNGIDWYLVYNNHGQVYAIPEYDIYPNDYILAELAVGDLDFEMTHNCKIEIE